MHMEVLSRLSCQGLLSVCESHSLPRQGGLFSTGGMALRTYPPLMQQWGCSAQMPLWQCHIKWMTQEWAKRLCQSCGLRVSQVLMCALSATTEKIGHRTYFLQPTVWHRSYHLQPIVLFPPFLRGCESCTRLSDSHGRNSWWQSSLCHTEWGWRVGLIVYSGRGK